MVSMGEYGEWGVESGLEVEEERKEGKDRYMFNPGKSPQVRSTGRMEGGLISMSCLYYILILGPLPTGCLYTSRGSHELYLSAQ
jgi:hypothetical protein